MTARPGPVSVFSSLWAHRHLVLQLAKRDVLSRYRGSALGLLWTLASPLLMLAVYAFVFGRIFEARWDLELGSRADFAFMLFAGLIVYWLFSECLNRAPDLMFENASYISKVVFPLEILPWVVLLSSLFHAALSLAVLLAAQLALIGPPPPSALLVPVVIVPVLLLALGACWFLASLGVYVRDLRQIVPVLTLMAMFLCPIFYPASVVPEGLRPALAGNPLAVAIEAFRAVLFGARAPEWLPLALWTVAAWVFAWLGLAWFQRTRVGFADVV